MSNTTCRGSRVMGRGLVGADLMSHLAEYIRFNLTHPIEKGQTV